MTTCSLKFSLAKLLEKFSFINMQNHNRGVSVFGKAIKMWLVGAPTFHFEWLTLSPGPSPNSSFLTMLTLGKVDNSSWVPAIHMVDLDSGFSLVQPFAVVGIWGVKQQMEMFCLTIN